MPPSWSFLEPLVPFVLGALGTLAASTFITSKRLRTELAQETEMLERLPRDARVELRADIRRRALLLASINRYAPITRLDLLLLFWLGVGYALPVYVTIALLTDRTDTGPTTLVVGTVGFTVGATLIWRLFYGQWRERANARIAFVGKRLGNDEAVTLVRMYRFGRQAARIAGPIGIAVVAVAYATASSVHLGWLDDERLLLLLPMMTLALGLGVTTLLPVQGPEGSPI
jgi:hypothetical protein